MNYIILISLIQRYIKNRDSNIKHSIFLWIDDHGSFTRWLLFEILSYWLKPSLVLNRKGWTEFHFPSKWCQSTEVHVHACTTVYCKSCLEHEEMWMDQYKGATSYYPGTYVGRVFYWQIYANARISPTFVRRTCLHPLKLIMNGPIEQLHIAHYQET